MKICAFCKTENLDAAHFCATCGQAFPKEEADPEANAAGTAADQPTSDISAGDVQGDETPKAEEEKDAFTPTSRPRSADRMDFCERFAPERMRNEIYSLAVYLWFCAGLNLFFGILSWRSADPLPDGFELMPYVYFTNLIISAFPSLLVAAADAILAVFVRKFSRKAALVGIVYSAVGGVILTVISVIEGGSPRVIVGWIASLFLFLGAFRTIKALDTAWEKYKADGIDPWGSPEERAKEATYKKVSKRNRSIAIGCGALVVVLAVVGILTSTGRYKTLNNGAWNGSVYTNEFFEFSYTLPEGWTRFTDEEQAAENKEYYGGNNVKKYGGALFTVYEGKSLEETPIFAYVEVVRQPSEDFGSLEMLQFWRNDNEALAKENGALYESEKIGTATVAGKIVMTLVEHYTYPAYDDPSVMVHEYDYTFLRQEGRYTFAISFYVYGVPLTPEELEVLLSAFAPYPAPVTE